MGILLIFVSIMFIYFCRSWDERSQPLAGSVTTGRLGPPYFQIPIPIARSMRPTHAIQSHKVVLSVQIVPRTAI